jgi:DNA-binding SARP family transcriptional activator
VEFRILGPLEVVDDDRLVELGGQKQRVLLAVLLLEANKVVSSDRLIDALWEDAPPDSAQKALQVYVSNLRKRLGRDRIVTKSPGYAIRVEPGELDLELFERLADEGGRQQWAAALALWRGPPLADFARSRFALSEVARLEERRLAVLEERIEADLALGRHADLVAEVESLVAEDPLRERLRALLMLALYRSGRQAEALEVYQDARRTLVEELGIEPGRELRELHQTILRQDPALDLAREPEATSVGADVGVGFVGRESELAELSAGLDEAFAGRGRLFLVQGEPGIGKSRLADELAGRAAARGAAVLVGRCWEAGGAPAYWPWTQSLRAYVRKAEPRDVRRQLGAGGGEVAQIVPELRELFPALPEPESSESEAARFRLFDSTAAFVRAAAADRPLALVLDDLHSADEPSLLLLTFVASVIGDSRILIVGTFRDLDPTIQDSLESTLAELGREPVTRRIHLAGLSEHEVALLAEVTGHTEPTKQLVAELHAETEGNPLFVSEIVRLLVAEGRLGHETGAIPIPETVREAIGRRLRRLSGECRRVLSLASVFGREFGLIALERVADYTGIDRLLRVLDEAITARVVEDVPGSFGRLRFGHALTRDTLYEEIPSTHRARLHRRVAEVLEDLYRGNLDPHLAELAHHFALAVPAAPPETAIAYARKAADRALALLAYEEAARLYELALEVLGHAVPRAEEERCDLLLALGESQIRAGNAPVAKETFFEAADVARRLGRSRELARAAAGYGGRLVWGRAGGDDRLVPLLEEGLAALDEGDVELRVRLLARLSGALRDEHSRDRREAISREAVEVARQTGSPAALAYALEGRAIAISAPDTFGDFVALGRELLEVADQIGDHERLMQGHIYQFMAHIAAGDVTAAEVELARASSIAGELRQPAQLWLVLGAQAMVAVAKGRFAEAEELIPQALVVGERAQPDAAIAHNVLERYLLADFQGRLEEVEPAVHDLTIDHPARPVFRCVRVHLLMKLGRRDEAWLDLADLARDAFSAVPFDQEWLFAMSFLAETAASLADTESAAALYDLLAPWAGHNAVDVAEGVRGSVSRYLGLLAAAMGRWSEAVSHFEDGLAMNERMGARPWLAHTETDYARMLLARNEPGDATQAAELLGRALATYRELGMDAYAARASSPAGGSAVHAP